ncbi:MAG: hypothetical protein WBG86_07515 [Polyangiales bacterium]
MGVTCETDLLEDPGFQFWCGERLCEWSTIKGDIAKVSTWHDHDYGVELVGAPVELRQPFARGTDGCALVEVVADAEPAADVTIAIDQDGDGTPEWSQALGSDGFEAWSWEVDLQVDGEQPPEFSFEPENGPAGIATIRKGDTGRAVLARLRISKECIVDRYD